MTTTQKNPLTELPEGAQLLLYSPGGAYLASRYANYWHKLLKDSIEAGLRFQGITFTYRIYTKPNRIQKLLGIHPSKIVDITLSFRQIYNLGIVESEKPFSFQLDVTEVARDVFVLTNPTQQSAVSYFVSSERYTGDVILIHAENITCIEFLKPVTTGVCLN